MHIPCVCVSASKKKLFGVNREQLSSKKCETKQTTAAESYKVYVSTKQKRIGAYAGTANNNMFTKTTHQRVEK